MSERSVLEVITIRSIGVIEEATLEFSPGLTVLTGETGAGKTMILTALNLILGGKSDSTLIRKGSERLVASARFSIPSHHSADFDNCGVLVEDNALIITRNVTSDGKSKATSNGISVATSTLSAISELLIEVHAQAANLSIGKSSKQRKLLDRYAGSEFDKALDFYSTTLHEYHALKTRISTFRKSFDQKEQELTHLREFVRISTKLKLKRGEYVEIIGQIERLSNVEELRIAGATALTTLDDDESGALALIANSRRALEAARSKDPALDAVYTVLSESFFLIDDSRSALRAYLDSLEADPIALDQLNARKSEIHLLVKRYGGTGALDFEADELVARFESSSDALSDLEAGDGRLQEMEEALAKVKKTLIDAAKTITDIRVRTARSLGDGVTQEIANLSMLHTSFHVDVESANYLSPKDSDFTPSGCDVIVMTISTHKDGPRVLLSKGASGGEMSRVMLALEVVIAATHPVGTYIFDEVDAGVGGKAAIEVGRRLYSLSQHAQVIVVTHLPQVAAWANSHFVVTKDMNGSVSQSDVRKVEGDDRVEEIARMLAGLENSMSAREHAAELLLLKG